jgi:hypothetical protein
MVNSCPHWHSKKGFPSIYQSCSHPRTITISPHLEHSRTTRSGSIFQQRFMRVPPSLACSKVPSRARPFLPDLLTKNYYSYCRRAKQHHELPPSPYNAEKDQRYSLHPLTLLPLLIVSTALDRPLWYLSTYRKATIFLTFLSFTSQSTIDRALARADF